jgi:hypothetical protein
MVSRRDNTPMVLGSSKRRGIVIGQRPVARGSVAMLGASETLAGDRAESTLIRTLRPALTVIRTWVWSAVVPRAIGPSARIAVAVHPLTTTRPIRA